MNLAAASSGSMSKKKMPIGKKISVGNVKHLGDKKNISLVKLGPSSGVYSNMNSMSGDSGDEDVFFSPDNNFLLGLAANTPKTKRVNTVIVCDFPLGSIDYDMNEDDGSLPPPLRISLNRKWVNPKIIKTQVEMFVNKSFALNINLSVVEGKSAMVKTQFIRKIFSSINSFGGAALLASEKEININSDLKKQEVCSDWAIVIKEILMNMPKKMIITAVSEFGDIKSIKIQLIRLWQKAIVEFAELEQTKQLALRWSFLIRKNSVHVVMTMFRDCFRVLLFTLLIETTAHDLGTLLDGTGEKTCVINCSLKTDNWTCCAICEKCGKFGHSALECDASNTLVFAPSKKTVKRNISDVNHLQLAKLYAKKNVVSFVIFSGDFWFESGSGSFSSGASDLSGGSPLVLTSNLSLNTYLSFLKHSLELLGNQISGIMHKLSSMKLVSLASSSSSDSLAAPVNVNVDLNSNMVLDNSDALPVSPPVVLALGINSSKILTIKVDCLEPKLVAFEASIDSVLAKLDQLCAGLGFQMSSASQ
ncbi:hypothetical protein G9A89_013753 [Geosiphon pyriformis]|nr:hypothetical protein G9A89_013753 [Geosiphon pyriformis]